MSSKGKTKLLQMLSVWHKWCWIFTFLLLVIGVRGQERIVSNHHILLEQLDNALADGNPRALRELGGFLAFPETKAKVVSILRKHSIFPKEQIQLDPKLSRDDFFAFLNRYEEEIQYSPIYRNFYTRPLEDFPVEHKLDKKRKLSDKEKSTRLKRLIKILNASSEALSESFVTHQLKEIAALNSFEAYDFLMGALEGKHMSEGLARASFIEEAICKALDLFDDPSILYAYLDVLGKGKLEGDAAKDLMSYYTNVRIEENDPIALKKAYEHLLDSLGTLNGLRKYGFEKESTARLDYFVEEVDYYGFLLSNFFMIPWMRENALRQMMKTGNAKALYHLSGVMYAQRNNDFFDMAVLEKQLDNYLNLYINVQDGTGKLIDTQKEDKDDIYYLNTLKYWAAHYQDYEYNSEEGEFINIKIEEENEESASKLFKKLTSENQKVAFVAYKSLVGYSPHILSRLNEKYQPILRRAHPKLPDFRYRFLENLAMLNEFCEIEDINTKILSELSKKIENLKNELPIQERYALEDEIIKEIGLSDFTALEIEGLIHSKNIPFNFSISRILDISYAKKFNEIVTDNTQIRLFLKKTVLFSRIGIGGICNRYPLKVEQIKDDLEPRLKLISKKEYDEDIRDAISYVLSSGEEDSSFAIPFKTFIQNPLELDERDLHMIEAPHVSEIKELNKKIEQAQDKTLLNLYLDYYSYHASPEFASNIISLLDNDHQIIVEQNGIKRTVADDAVRMLEGVFSFSFRQGEGDAPRDTAPLWLAFSKKHKKTEDWQQALLDIHVSRLAEKEFLDIEELNTILGASSVTPAILERTLSLLPKLDKKNDVRKLELSAPLDIKYLEYFKPLEFKAKYLDDIIGYFKKEDQTQLLDFSLSFLNGTEANDQGKVFNRICDVEGMMNTLAGAAPKIKENIISNMMSYLNESDFISEFEEKRILKRVFFLKYGNLPIKEQLKKAASYTEDKKQQYNIQQSLLNGIKLSDLSQILEGFEYLVDHQGESPLQFLQKNLGLSSYLFETPEKRKKLQKDVQEMNPIDFYVHYLKMSGLDIRKLDRALDFEKIGEVLEFDVVSPFSSTISKSRSHYAIGIMNLLENQFPKHIIPKGVGHELRKQAQEWLQFLEEKGLIDKDNITHSFNHQS